jgi:hypothetical protein
MPYLRYGIENNDDAWRPVSRNRLLETAA